MFNVPTSRTLTTLVVEMADRLCCVELCVNLEHKHVKSRG